MLELYVLNTGFNKLEMCQNDGVWAALGAKPVPARLTYQEQEKEGGCSLRVYRLQEDSSWLEMNSIKATACPWTQGRVLCSHIAPSWGCSGLRERDVGFLCPHHSPCPTCPEPTS